MVWAQKVYETATAVWGKELFQLRSEELTKDGKDTATLLLVLRTWVLRYRVPLKWILQTLYRYYEKPISRAGRKPTMGITIATLCGSASQTIIEEAIMRHFPNGENELDWKHRQRLLAAPPPPPKQRSDNVRKFIKDYVSWISSRKKTEEATNMRMKRRPYRGNPWR